MKKSIIIILCVSIGVIAFVLFPKPEEHSATIKDPPMAQIDLANHIEDDMSWEYVSRLLQTLVEVGCVDVNINGFYWDCNPCLVRSFLPQYEDLDEITIPYIFKESRPRVAPNPSVQYDLNVIKAWCERNQNKHSQIKFGADVRFNAVREITGMFHNHKMKFDLLSPDDEGDERSIEIKLYQPPMRK